MTDAERFLEALAGDLPKEERLILCGFTGDPNTAPPNAWRPRPWRPGRDIVINERANGYVCVASFRRAGDGSFRRRTETFAGGLTLMVDDIGTKIPEDQMLREDGEPLLEPTAIVETSPGNYQWWYFLREPERDVAKFDGLIRAFISGKLLGADPGMSGVTRVGRLPGFVNGKEKYGGWVTKLTAFNPYTRYSPQELLDAFGLKIAGRREPRTKLHSEEAIERNRAFGTMYKWLDLHGMLKKHEPDPSGWTEMRCPWIENHTGGADTGAAIREPNPENDYYGAFRCHHGHCADKGWAELTEYIADESEQALNDAAENDK